MKYFIDKVNICYRVFRAERFNVFGYQLLANSMHNETRFRNPIVPITSDCFSLFLSIVCFALRHEFLQQLKSRSMFGHLSFSVFRMTWQFRGYFNLTREEKNETVDRTIQAFIQ